MEFNEERIRKKLDKLLKNPKTIEEFISIKFLIDDYLELGYHIKDYVSKYNICYQRFQSKRTKELSEKLKNQI